MIIRLRRVLVRLFFIPLLTCLKFRTTKLLQKMMLLSVKKKMAEKEFFQWTTFIKREQMRVFIRLAQNYGSTNEKLGFFLWSLLFRSLCSSFNTRIVLNKYITIPLFKAMG